MKAVLFPGQGSQRKGMGADLFEKFKDLTARADEILGYSIKECCLENPGNILSQTQYTQPALYIVNALTYFDRVKEMGIQHEFAAGHSLGEYNALHAAGAFDFETGLRLVITRGQLMSRASGGGMAAVAGLTREEVEDILSSHRLKLLFIANINFRTQIVLSGPRSEIDLARPLFERAGAELYVPLSVSGAFHTPFMQTAQEEFAKYLQGFQFSKLQIPVVSNVHGRPYDQAAVKETLSIQLASPVKWYDGVRYLISQGVQDFEEMGPGRVLTGLTAKILQEVPPDVYEDSAGEKSAWTMSALPAVESKAHEPAEDVSPDKDRNIPSFHISAESLGSDEFKRDYSIKYAYVAGSMYRAISSIELVAAMVKAGMFAFFGTGGLSLHEIEKSIQWLKNELGGQGAFGMNLLPGSPSSRIEDETVDLFLKYGIRHIEASSYVQITPPLVRYRLEGIYKDDDGVVHAPNMIMAKLSRPEVAHDFLSPPPDRIVAGLLKAGQINAEKAELSRFIPMADDICAEADSGGHTDQASANTLLPTMLRLRDEMVRGYGFARNIRVGAAGGIGTPEAAAAAFFVGADFILTGSINQCTVEAGTSDTVKDLLQQMNIQDTAMVPAGDMFEMGSKVQVLKRGVFFPARANKLFDLYKQYDSWEAIDEKTRTQIEKNYFKRSFQEMLAQAARDSRSRRGGEDGSLGQSPRHKMTTVFKYFLHTTTEMALEGDKENIVNFQIQCGPSLGAFNQWVKGTGFEDWRNRHVAEIAKKLMSETALFLTQRFKAMIEGELRSMDLVLSQKVE